VRSTLSGKCALITGSTQGLGLAAARHLAAAGCHIALHGLADERSMGSLCREIAAAHDVRTTSSSADLRHAVEIEHMLSSALEAFGAVDILVNNAVIRHTGPIETFSRGDWDEAIAVNLSAAFHTIRLALPAMKRKNWGRIINVSSIYGLVGARDRVGYVTAKTALIGLTRAVALETADYNITCNAVCPGTADTPVHDATIRATMAAEGLSRADAEHRILAAKQPTGRLISADSVAALMVFLCGADSADITGAILPIDGGWSAQ
jgi:3-hydroxybutyrate dehydrogenase